MYGVITTGTSFNTGIIQHSNRLKFAISNNLNGPSLGEAKLIIDSTTIYLNQETYCMGDMTFSAGVNGLISSMVGLGNVDNTSDANKPVSTAQLTALN